MKSTKNVSPAPYIVGVIAFALIAFGAYKWVMTAKKESAAVRGERKARTRDDANLSPAEKAMRDRAKLKDASLPVQQKASSLYSLSAQNDPEALTYVLTQLETETGAARHTLIQALGLMNHEKAQKKLEDLSRSTELRDRMGALTAMGFKPNPANAKLLETFLKQKKLDVSERIQALASYYRVTNKPDQKTKALNELIKIAKDAKTDEVKNRANSQIFTLASQSEQVIAHARKLAQSGEPKFSADVAKKVLRNAEKRSAAKPAK